MKKTLLKKLTLSILFMTACTSLYATISKVEIGGTTIDVAQDASGTGWTWTADSNLISLTSDYPGDSIWIGSNNKSDVINLSYTGDVTIRSSTRDAIRCEGALRISRKNGENGQLSFVYDEEKGRNYAMMIWGKLTINSGDIHASSTATATAMKNEKGAVVCAAEGFLITGDANLFITTTSEYVHGFRYEDDSEISTTGTVSINATGKGYAFLALDGLLTIQEGIVSLSNSDTPENMIWGNNLQLSEENTTLIYNNGIPPTLSSSSPANGTHETEVTLSGTDLAGIVRITANGKEAKLLTAEEGEVTFIMPAGVEGEQASFLVETTGGGAFLKNRFTYDDTSYRVTFQAGGDGNGYLGFCDVAGNNSIQKPDDPTLPDDPKVLFTGKWYKDEFCIIGSSEEYNFEDVITEEKTIYALFYETERTPADKEKEVAINTPISIGLNISFILEDKDNITISPDPGNVEAVTDDSNTYLFTITHDAFEYNTEYTVTIPANTMISSDFNEPIFTKDLSWSFTTEQEAALSSLTVSKGVLSPVFNAETTAYTVKVENEITEITISAAANVPEKTTVTGDGTKSLNEGSNVFDIVAKAENGTEKTYKITVIRQSPPLSSDATLKKLSVSEGTLAPVFNASVLQYAVEVASEIDEITIQATANSSAATVKGTGTKKLAEEENMFNIVVTAEDGSKKTYQIAVTHESQPVGIENIDSENDIAVYPNPITDYFCIKGITQPAVVSVYTIYGKTIWKRKVQAEENIFVGNIPSGIYLITVDGTAFKVVKR